MIRRNSVFCLVILSILFMSVGYSSFNNNLYIDNMGMVVRAVKDIRITNISLLNSNNATSSYEEYDVNSVVMGVNLNSVDSSITYVVDVTNYGNAEMGIFGINGIDESSNITYEISNYNIKDKICNEENICSNGITKSIYITIKYKENVDVSINNYNLKFTFDFRMFHSVSYEGIEISSEFVVPFEVLDGDDLVVNFVPYIVADADVYYGSLLFTDYTYVDGILTIKNVNQDVKIVAITYEKEAMESEQASRNLQDSISLVQTTEGALSEVHSILQRMLEITVQVLNSEFDSTDLDAFNLEIDILISEINYISEETMFDVYDILNTDRVYEIVLPRENINYNLYKINSSILNIDNVDYISKDTGEEFLTLIQSALNSVSSYRSYLGGMQNEFEYLIRYFEETTETLNCSDRLEVTYNNLAIVSLGKIRDFLDTIVYLETGLEYDYVDEFTVWSAGQQIKSVLEGINYIVNDAQLRGVYFLKGDYSFIPNVSTDYLGEGNTPLFFDFSTPENITKSKNDAIQALDRINNLINQLSNNNL